MRMQSWCKTMGAGTWGRRGVGSLVGGGVWVGARGSTSLARRFFFFSGRRKMRKGQVAFCLFGGWPDFWMVVCVGKTAGGAPCRLRSEAWLAGSPVHARCPALAMDMQQRWEVEAGLDTAWWSRMAGCAAEGGSAEADEEKGPLRPGTGRVWCRCVL